MSVTMTLLTATFIIVVLVDQLNVFEDFLFKPLWKLLTKLPYQGWSFKPFSCSTCMAWWTNLLIIILTGNLTFTNVMVSLFLSWATFTINDLLIIFRELWTKLVCNLMAKIHRNEK